MSILQVSEVYVRFGGNMAVNQVSLHVDEGAITGLIGPNGAGKTTLFNVITGLQSPSSGKVEFDGRDITSTRAHKRAQMGIARTFQRLEVFGSLTARENILTAAEMRRSWSSDRGGADAVTDTERIIDLVGLREVAGRRADSLSTGLARLVELGRALACRPRVLLLDEPASGLDEQETAQFGDLLLDLVDTGMGILLVEHDVPLVMRLCSCVHVLNFGEILASGEPSEIQHDQAVLDAYLGQAAPTRASLPADQAALADAISLDGAAPGGAS
ncbi:MAG: ABC-type branched-chain amino acid transport system, ATPase component [Acidimicrobiales bacterium]|nr:ABC-type branched-chain amino acid transport system, ATPase component [Acidimicrobiales bacterium]